MEVTIEKTLHDPRGGFGKSLYKMWTVFIDIGEDDLFPWFDFKRKKHADDFVTFVNAGRIDKDNWNHIHPDSELFRCYQEDENWDEADKVNDFY